MKKAFAAILARLRPSREGWVNALVEVFVWLAVLLAWAAIWRAWA